MKDDPERRLRPTLPPTSSILQDQPKPSHATILPHTQQEVEQPGASASQAPSPSPTLSAPNLNLASSPGSTLAPQRASSTEPWPTTALSPRPGIPSTPTPPIEESTLSPETLASGTPSPATRDQLRASSPSRSSPSLDVKDAYSYLEMVKTEFQERPDVYNQFLDTMHDFNSQTIDTPGVIEKVSTLFKSHPSLIQGFNAFLPQGYKIECSQGEDSTNTITVTTPTGIHIQTTDGSVQHSPRSSVSRPAITPGVAQPKPYSPPELPGALHPTISPYFGGVPRGAEAPPAPLNDSVLSPLTTPVGLSHQHDSTTARHRKRPFDHQADDVNAFPHADAFKEVLQMYLGVQPASQSIYKPAPVMFDGSTDFLDEFGSYADTTETPHKGSGTEGVLFAMIGQMATPLVKSTGSKDRRSSHPGPLNQSQTGCPSDGLDTTAATGKRKERLERTGSSSRPLATQTTRTLPRPSDMPAPNGSPGPSRAKKPKHHHNNTEHQSPHSSSNSTIPNYPSQPSWPAEPLHSVTDTMLLTHDIGPAITWISALPVKINGHFCDLFEGTHLKAGKVALKRPRVGASGYDDVVVRRFEREAATWRNLRHPHILEFLGTFKRDGHIYFVSPFIKNGTLAEYIEDHPNVNRIKLMCETADALRYLQKEGVVHGDIKANNILIGDNGYSLLCDFGLTKSIDSRTSTAMRGAGTFRWQSPELWDDAPKTFESDVYAFSMTIVEVLTGKVPFADYANDVAVMRAVLLRDERPSRIPTESSNGISYGVIWDVAAACWLREPADRLSMSEALEWIQADPSFIE